jgi:hypothetical protein
VELDCGLGELLLEVFADVVEELLLGDVGEVEGLVWAGLVDGLE